MSFGDEQTDEEFANKFPSCHRDFWGIKDIETISIGGKGLLGHPDWLHLPNWLHLPPAAPKICVVPPVLPQWLQLTVALAGMYTMTEEFWNSDGVNGCLMKYKPWIKMHKGLYISPAVRDHHQKEVRAIEEAMSANCAKVRLCLLYTSPSPRDS